MNRIRKILCLLSFLAVINTCYADESICKIESAKDLYSPLVLDEGFAIRFKYSNISVDPSGDIFPITIVGQNCDTGTETQIAELPYLGDPGKIESAFLADSNFDGKAELFVIHRTTLYSDTGISYGSDYFTTLIYRRLSPLTYEWSERVSTYFGAGGDILLSPESDELIYVFPYKTESSIQNELFSEKYRAWLEQKAITTKILRKTYLHNQANVADKSTKYLIAEDTVHVVGQNAGWLNIVFYNKKKGAVKGWIQCHDTAICDSAKDPLK
ncbi:hypothetical protein [Pseudomonas sp.]|jgi:hypothetical protein|uniref:hypothetical protein n=1 Tax=Pseudomonas sp. TaxID=306 RepID=UPI0039822147